MAGDMQHNGFQEAFKYFKYRKCFNLNVKMILYAMIETLKRKNVAKHK
jgi:hypothetical protein